MRTCLGEKGNYQNRKIIVLKSASYTITQLHILTKWNSFSKSIKKYIRIVLNSFLRFPVHVCLFVFPGFDNRVYGRV